MCVCVQSFSAVSDSLRRYSPPRSSVLGTPQERILKLVVMSFSRGSSRPRDQACIFYVSCIGRWVLLSLAPPGKPFSSVQFSSVAQSCPTLCNPMNRNTPGLPVHHQLLEFIQAHVHQVGDAIQPSHPLLSPSPPAPNPSQHQSLFQ